MLLEHLIELLLHRYKVVGLINRQIKMLPYLYVLFYRIIGFWFQGIWDGNHGILFLMFFLLGAGVVENWRHIRRFAQDVFSLNVSTFSTEVARIQLLLLPLSQAWLVLWLVGTINESSQWRWHRDSGSLETCQKHCFQIFFLSAKNSTLLRLARRDRAGNILWKNQMDPPY